MGSHNSVIRVQLFAGAASLAGTRTITIQSCNMPQDENGLVQLSCVRSEVLSQHPELEPLAEHSRFAVDNEFVSDRVFVHARQAIALIPPVSGG